MFTQEESYGMAAALVDAAQVNVTIVVIADPQYAGLPADTEALPTFMVELSRNSNIDAAKVALISSTLEPFGATVQIPSMQIVKIEQEQAPGDPPADPSVTPADPPPAQPSDPTPPAEPPPAQPVEMQAPQTDDLEDKTVEELYEMAQDLDIEGRSEMLKADLIVAIRTAQGEEQ